MTKIKILEVIKGAEYNGVIYDYWVNCQLTNGQVITLFDYKCFELTNEINKNVRIKIKTLFFEEGQKTDFCFEGVIKYYKNSYFFLNNFIEIEIPTEEIKSKNFILNKESIYSFGRLDIEKIYT